MVVFVIREEEDLLHPPCEIGIVIKGVEVLNKSPSLAHVCAMLLSLIYDLNLSYPSELNIFGDGDGAKDNDLQSAQPEGQAQQIRLIQERHRTTARSLFCVMTCIHVYCRRMETVTKTNTSFNAKVFIIL